MCIALFALFLYFTKFFVKYRNKSIPRIFSGLRFVNSARICTMGQNILKRPAPPKKLVKLNKSISRNFILTKFHFLQFQKWPKFNFLTGEKFKTAKNSISCKKNFDLYNLTSFFALTFFNYLARCVLIF